MAAFRNHEMGQSSRPPSGDQFVALCGEVDKLGDSMIRVETLMEEREKESTALWEETKRNGRRIEDVMTVVGRAEGSLRQIAGAVGKLPAKVGAHEIRLEEVEAKAHSALERVHELAERAESAAFKRKIMKRLVGWMGANWKIIATVLSAVGAMAAWLSQHLDWVQ